MVTSMAQFTAACLPGEPPLTEDPGGLQSIGWQRVGHNWSNLALSFDFVCSSYSYSSFEQIIKIKSFIVPLFCFVICYFMYVRISNIYVVTKFSNKTTVMHLSWKILHLTSTCLISLSGSSASHVVWTLCLSFFCFCFFLKLFIWESF